MPEPRFDPLGRRWVLLAPERARRGAPPIEPTPPDPEPCDFCAGHESKTPPEVAAVRSSGSRTDGPGWTVRAFPNLYPAAPFHEVVVHTPDHHRRLEELEARHRADVWRLYRDRVTAGGRAAAVVPLINRGRAAGGSRTHDHGQIFGLAVVPPVLERESLGGDCAVCAMASATAVAEHDGLGAFVHPAPLVADEVVVVGGHEPRFGDASDADAAALGEIVAVVVRKLREARGDGLAFNVVVHTAPRGTDAFHWHAHVMPRTAVWGGLEVGTELPVVATDPTETQRILSV